MGSKESLEHQATTIFPTEQCLLQSNITIEMSELRARHSHHQSEI